MHLRFAACASTNGQIAGLHFPHCAERADWESPFGGVGCRFEEIAHRHIEALVEPITQLSPDFGGAEASHKTGNGDGARVNRLRAPEKALSIVFRTPGLAFDCSKKGGSAHDRW